MLQLRNFYSKQIRRQRQRQPRALIISIAILLLLSFCIFRTSYQRSDSHVSVAYFIQASKTNVELVPRLIGALCDYTTPKPAFAIHLDASISPIFANRTIASCQNSCPHARILRVPPEYVTYRGVTLALNYLSGAATLLRARVQFDYFVNLSGADYPTARASLISSLLAHAAPYRLSFVEWKPRKQWRRFARGRLGRIFVDTALVSNRPGLYLMPPNEEFGYPAAPEHWRNPVWPHIGFTIAKTSGWFIWHRELVEYLVLDAFPRKLYGTFHLSDASDEHIYATAIWNNAYYRERAVAHNMRSIFFVAPNGSFALADDGVSRRRQHPYFVDDVDDGGNLMFWNELWNNPSFFTRKVRVGGSVTDKIDREMLGVGGGRRNEYERRLVTSFESVLDKHFLEFPHVGRKRPPPFRSLFVSV